jgi:hypothetical protein
MMFPSQSTHGMQSTQYVTVGGSRRPPGRPTFGFGPVWPSSIQFECE